MWEALAAEFADLPDTSQATRLVVRLLVAGLMGALIGFGIDYWAHTSPLGLIVGVGLGFCAGVMNVMRTAKAYSQRHPVNPNAPSIPDDED